LHDDRGYRHVCGRPHEDPLMNDKNMAARLIAAAMNDKRDELERDVDHTMNPVIAMTDSLIDIALGALRELARLRGTTVEACLVDLLDGD
jgi:hypothetical protein